MTTVQEAACFPDLTEPGLSVYTAKMTYRNVIVKVQLSLHLYDKNREDRCYEVLSTYAHRTGHRLGNRQIALAEHIERLLMQHLLERALAAGWQRIEEKYYGMTFVFYTPPGA